VARQRQKNEPKECDCTRRSLKPDSLNLCRQLLRSRALHKGYIIFQEKSI